MNKKALGVFVSLLVVAMLALPMSAAFAAKPEPNIEWYSIPGFAEPDIYYAGKSDNMFWVWTDLPFTWCWDYTVITLPGPPPMDVCVPVDTFAEGFYDGLWIAHGNGPVITVRETFTMTFTNFMGKDGTVTIKGEEHMWTIISGTEDLANIHGRGTIETEIMMQCYKFVGTIHFSP